MSVYLIEGGHKLCGEVEICGAKNAVLPILAASLLCEKSVLLDCPHLSDVRAAQNILCHLGCDIAWCQNNIEIQTQNSQYRDLSSAHTKEMRSSILFLGAILAKFKKATISYPGGCELGARPVDIHINSLRKLGACIDDTHGFLTCTLDGRFTGADITLPFPSVGATENIILAAATAVGTTLIYNAAREPEISDLISFLNKSGADISIFQDKIQINGVEHLTSCSHKIIPDRIEAATFMCACAITAGEMNVTNCCPSHLSAVIPIFEEMGCRMDVGKNSIFIQAPPKLSPISYIKTMPYPGFPTDAQAPIMAALCLASGNSVIIENIFESRYKHVSQLRRMGAKILTEGRTAIIEGTDNLFGADVHCTDLRGGASLVVAGLAAKGVTIINDIWHLDRGYYNLENKLTKLGAKIERI